MKKIILILIFVTFKSLATFAQQIPLGSCGIVYIYDAAGNRTKRLYYCNNGGPYPTVINPVNPNNEKNGGEGTLTKDDLKNMEFQSVDALYPNPTSGKFYITFSKQLSNALIIITDANGKRVQEYRANGYRLTCDLSGVASGIYFIRIEDEGNIITKKVIKQ